MAKSCRPGPRQKRSLQTFSDDVQAVDACKKTKVAGDPGEALDAPHRSSRSNMGKGGQKLQLENLECVQTQGTTRVSRLATAIANKPFNPMAPMAINTGSHVSGHRAVTESWGHSSAHPAPLLTYQSALENSRYGFNVSVQEKPSFGSQEQSPTDSMAPFATSGVRSHPVTVSVVLHHDLVSLTHHVPIIHSGLPTPTPSRGGSIAPTRTGSAVPASRTGSIVPSSHSGSLTLPSRTGSVSCGGSVAPSPRPSSVPTTEVSYSAVVAGSDMHQQTQKLSKVTRTYLIHGGEDMELSPPRYVDDDAALSDGREDEDFAQPYGQPSVDKRPIDEVSPDEDEQVAQNALRGVHGTRSGAHHILASQEVPPLDKASSDEDEGIAQKRHGRPAARQIPDDSQIDPSLERSRNDARNDHSVTERHWISSMDPDDARDVINDYHQRNRFPCPPDPLLLREISVCSTHGTLSVISPIHAPVLLPMPQEQAPLPQDVTAAEGPKYPLDGDPTKLQTYPIAARPFIEQAKLVAQCNSAVIHPFLSRTDFLGRSFEFYTEAWAEVTNLDIPRGIWPHYRKDLGVLLWEAMMSWRSTLKAKAREIVPRHYTLNESQTAEENKVEANELIQGSAFTYDTEDNDGSANNMAALALCALIQSFFYHGPSSLAIKFPDVFTAEVPPVTVCLVATALRAAIDEYTKSGVREDQNFEYQGYSKIFAGFCLMQQAIDKVPKHTKKTKKLRIEWAHSSNVPANEPGNIVALEDDFVPVLN